MGTRREDFPSLSVGAVIRIHDMETQPFLGESTGRVWNPAKVTVIEGGIGDPIKPYNADQWDDSFRFTECDVAKVKKLRGWWASLPRAGPPPPPLPVTGSQFPTETEGTEAPSIAETPGAEAEAEPGPSTQPASQPSSQTIPEPDSQTVSRGVPESSEESEVDPNEVTVPEEHPPDPPPVRRSKRSFTVPEEESSTIRRSKRSRKQRN